MIYNIRNNNIKTLCGSILKYNSSIANNSNILLRSDYFDKGICKLTLNLPKNFNSLSYNMLVALESELDILKKQVNIRVVIIGSSNDKAILCWS